LKLNASLRNSIILHTCEYIVSAVSSCRKPFSRLTRSFLSDREIRLIRLRVPPSRSKLSIRIHLALWTSIVIEDLVKLSMSPL
jgi:hypothetical protein